jgi:hypothetical protein
MASVVLNIKGRDWTFQLITDKRFDKLHNQEDQGRAAVTMPNQYEVHFRKSDWCIKDIRHELGHVLYEMSGTGTADPDSEQVEEIMCEIIAEYTPEIILWSDRISEKFFGRE